jgi:putative tryptophan/tyrosine transport system substrate-binding protein
MQSGQLQRRAFITLLGGVAAWPLAVRAQQAERTRRIAVLMGIGPDADGQVCVAALRKGLQDLGWVAGRTISIEEYWSAGDESQLRENAAKIIELQLDIIVVYGSRALTVLQQANATIPVVLIGTNNPSGGGFAASLSRPVGNVTGFIMFELSLLSKLLDVLKQLAPKVTNVALLASVHNPNASVYLRALEPYAVAENVKTRAILVSELSELQDSIAEFSREPNPGILIPPDVFNWTHSELIMGLAVRHRLPVVTAYRRYTANGGLASYGVDESDLFRRSSSYVDRILKGEKPTDLPMQAATKFDLVINRKTAGLLGLDLPLSLLATADEVIE